MHDQNEGETSGTLHSRQVLACDNCSLGGRLLDSEQFKAKVSVRMLSTKRGARENGKIILGVELNVDIVEKSRANGPQKHSARTSTSISKLFVVFVA